MTCFLLCAPSLALIGAETRAHMEEATRVVVVDRRRRGDVDVVGVGVVNIVVGFRHARNAISAKLFSPCELEEGSRQPLGAR